MRALSLLLDHRRLAKKKSTAAAGRTPRFIMPLPRRRRHVPTNHNNNCRPLLLSLVTRGAVLWVVGFITLAGMDPGRAFYSNLAARVVPHDAKAAVPLVHMTLPLVLAAGLVGLGWTTTTKLTTTQKLDDNNNKSSSTGGDWHVERGLAAVVLLPCVSYFVMICLRHLYGYHVNEDHQVMQIANALGMVAVVASSIWLIPLAVSLQDALPAALLGSWVNGPMHGMRLHIWTGYIIVIGSLLHGAGHIYRWAVIEHHTTAMESLFPPKQCWTTLKQQPRFCYNLFRNLTGLIGGVALAVIFVTSFHAIRRRCYRLFYLAHLLAAPAAIVFMVLHYNKTILYMAPSLLLYTASAMPLAMERWMAHLLSTTPTQQQQEPLHNSQVAVPILQVEPIGPRRRRPEEGNDHDNNSSDDSIDTVTHMSLTIEASELAIQRFRPGHHVRLWVPEITTLQSHPFTINTTTTTTTTGAKNLCIIFKVSKRFTSQLAQKLMACSAPSQDDPDSEMGAPGSKRVVVPSASAASLPLLRIHMHGFFGNPNRLEQALGHDTVLFVAGGIGLTPYLSMIQEIQESLLLPFNDSSQNNNNNDDDNSDRTPSTSIGGVTTKQVVFIWFCRERALASHVKREYLNPLLEQAKEQMQRQGGRSDYGLSVTILHTGRETNYSDSGGDETSSNAAEHEPRQQAPASAARQIIISQDGTAPFLPSRFASGTGTSMRSNLLNFATLTLTCVTGLYSIWWCYHHMQKVGIGSRIWALLAVLVVGIAVAAIANLIAALCDWDLMVLDETFGRGGRRGSAAFQPIPSSNQDDDGLFMDATNGRDGLMKSSGLDSNDDENNIELVEHAASQSLNNKTDFDPESEDAIAHHDEVENNISVRLNERQGRGNLSELLYTENAKRPGVFACGPPSLMKDVRRVVANQQKFRHASRQCSPDNSQEYQRIAFYEEAFAM